MIILSMIIHNPYSIYRYAGDNLGGMEAVTGRACTVITEKLGETAYRIVVTVGEHPAELEERLAKRRYAYKPGEAELERCPECGVPSAVARCRRDLESGIIRDPSTGRSMALFGPASLDAAFDELESELGEAIPETVIEAQRQYARGSLSREDWEAFSASLDDVLAARGLGLPASFEVDERHLEAAIRNSCVHLWTVGILQGLFELVMGIENATREWSLSPDGDLSVRISA